MHGILDKNIVPPNLEINSENCTSDLEIISEN
jgi:hypothetical protein